MIILVIIMPSNAIAERNKINDPIIFANTLNIVVITSSMDDPIFEAPVFALLVIFS